MANDLEQNSDAVLSTAIAKDGPVTVSSTQIHDVVVQVFYFPSQSARTADQCLIHTVCMCRQSRLQATHLCHLCRSRSDSYSLCMQAVAASSYPPVSPVPVVSGASPGGSPAQGISPSSGDSHASECEYIT